MSLSFSDPVVGIPSFLGGLVALYYGAEFLVAGASSMALRYGIPALIVGLTVVAFGTSAPELLVSLLAVFEGNDGISVGNIIGSNIANIALILGCASMVRPIEVNAEVVKREYPIMLLATALFVGCAYDGSISRVDGIIFLVCMAAFLTYSLRKGLSSGEEEELPEELADLDLEHASNARDLGRLGVGIVGLAIGAYLLVEAAKGMATAMKIPDSVVGITVVAIGTSLPELATSVVAAYRGESDISVGNVIGSNIFNVWLVLGLVAVILPIAINDPLIISIDLWVMAAVSVLIWPLMSTGLRINRAEGALLLVGYLAYTIYLFLTRHAPAVA